MMPDSGPNLGVLPGHVQRDAAPFQVDSHRHQACYTDFGGLRDHFGGVSELLEVEVCIDEVELYVNSPSIRLNSSSTTLSSSFLNSACGSRSFWPATNPVGFHTGSCGYSPASTVCDRPG